MGGGGLSLVKGGLEVQGAKYSFTPGSKILVINILNSTHYVKKNLNTLVNFRFRRNTN